MIEKVRQLQADEAPVLGADPFSAPTPDFSEDVAGPLNKLIAQSIKSAKVTRPKVPGELAIKTPQGVVGVTQEATRMSSRGFDTFDITDTAQPNFNVMQTTDDVRAVIADFGERYKGKIDAKRRDVITDEQMRELAQDVGGDLEVIRQVMTKESGSALPKPEVVLAARQIHLNSATRLKELADKIVGGNATDKDKLAFAQQQEFHKNYNQQFMAGRAEAGRLLHAYGIPVTEDSQQVQRISELVETMGRGDMKRMADMISQIDTPSGISAVVNNYKKSRAIGVLQELFINGILSGLKTHIVNGTGNALFQAMNVAETAVAARVGRFMGHDEGVMVGEAQAMMYGQMTAFQEAMSVAWQTMKTGESATVKFEKPIRRAISSEQYPNAGALGPVIDMLGAVIRAPTERLMAPMDEAAKSFAYRADLARSSLNAAMKARATEGLDDMQTAALLRDLMEHPPDEAVASADAFALYSTFQNPLGEGGQKIQALINAWPALRFIAPFVRTPTNLFKDAYAERSPLAVFSQKFRADVTGKNGQRAQDMAIARAGMGSLTVLSVAAMAQSGMITGGGPSNFEGRQLLESTTGFKPYSIRVLNPVTGKSEWHSYARIEPLAFVIGATADAVDILNNLGEEEVDQELLEESYNAMAAIMAGVMENTMSKTFLSGPAEFFAMVREADTKMDSYLKSRGGGFVPFSGTLRDLERIDDPYLREAWTALNKIKQNVPGLSDNLPLRLDVLGNPRAHPRGSFLGPMSPWPDDVIDTDPRLAEVARVMQSTRKVPLTKMSKRYEGMMLQEKEYHALMDLSRNKVKLDLFDEGEQDFENSLYSLMKQDVYREATDDGKAILLRQVQQTYDRQAKAIMESEDEPEFILFRLRLRKHRADKILRERGPDAVADFLSGDL